MGEKRAQGNKAGWKDFQGNMVITNTVISRSLHSPRMRGGGGREADRSFLPVRYPDLFTGPVTGSIPDTDPSTGNPSTPAVIVGRVPRTRICWWGPDSPVCPMSIPARRRRWVLVGICSSIFSLTARFDNSTPDNCRTDADSHSFPSMMLSTSRPRR